MDQKIKTDIRPEIGIIWSLLSLMVSFVVGTQSKNKNLYKGRIEKKSTADDARLHTCLPKKKGEQKTTEYDKIMRAFYVINFHLLCNFWCDELSPPGLSVKKSRITSVYIFEYALNINFYCLIRTVFSHIFFLLTFFLNIVLDKARSTYQKKNKVLIFMME